MNRSVPTHAFESLQASTRPLSTCLTLVTLLLALLLAACGNEEPVATERYTASDRLFSKVIENVKKDASLTQVTEIDHSRLGAGAGSVMPPARVLIFSDVKLEAELLALNPLVAVDLPLRVLAYEAPDDGKSYVISNEYEFIRSRYDLPDRPDIEAAYNKRIASALAGVSPQQVASFPQQSMEGKGLISIDSPYGFDTTLQRVLNAIQAQDDTMIFGQVDFQQLAQREGVMLNPNTLILFGAPAPGAKAMNEAPTLGLNGFCQKFLVWQDEKGRVRLSYNDLLALAEQQGAGSSVALRVIRFRMNKVFEEALAAE